MNPQATEQGWRLGGHGVVSIGNLVICYHDTTVTECGISGLSVASYQNDKLRLLVLRSSFKAGLLGQVDPVYFNMACFGSVTFSNVAAQFCHCYKLSPSVYDIRC